MQEISIGIQTDPAPEYDASVVDIAMSLEDRITEIFHNAAAEDARIVMDSVAAAAAAAAVTTATPLPAPEEVKAEVEVEAEVEVKAEEEKMVWSAETSPDDDDPVRKDRSSGSKMNLGGYFRLHLFVNWGIQFCLNLNWI